LKEQCRAKGKDILLNKSIKDEYKRKKTSSKRFQTVRMRTIFQRRCPPDSKRKRQNKKKQIPSKYDNYYDESNRTNRTQPNRSC